MDLVEQSTKAIILRKHLHLVEWWVRRNCQMCHNIHPYFSFLFIILGQKWWYTIFLNNNFMQPIKNNLTCTQEDLVFFLLILYFLVFRLHVSLHLNGVNQCWAGIKKMMRTAQVFKLFSSRFSTWRPTNMTTSNSFQKFPIKVSKEGLVLMGVATQ